MNSGRETTNAPSAHALAAAVEDLLESSMYSMDDDAYIEFIQHLETSFRKLDAVKQRCALESVARGLPARAGVKSPILFLQETLRLSYAEAATRVRNADLLSTVSEGSMTRPPVLPHVAEAQRAGEISADHIKAINDALKQIPDAAGPEVKERAEQHLTAYARQGDPKGVTTLGVRILANVDPDGRLIEDRDRQRVRGIKIGNQRIDGMYPITGLLTPQLGAVMKPMFEKFGRPGMCNPDDPESPWTTAELGLDTELDDGDDTGDVDVDDPSLTPAERARAAVRAKLRAAAKKDHRTAEQRNHDALMVFFRPDMGPTRLGSHRGLPVSTIITMSIDDLEKRAGVATTATGGTMSITQALQVARNSTPYLVVLDRNGRPLHLSRGQRLANPAQRLALTATERGCTRPGCDAPASRSAVHHIKEWADGGETDIENLTFACDACHAQVNSGPNGWKTIVMPDDSEHPGKTGWIPPPHIDPARRPRVNFRHHPRVSSPSGVPGIPARRLC
ncbi:DUF222 domain-containing protein [Nocardia sp. NPDC005978]|uniref:HNH endonuclease signature motif containing protein n=1 Tax=Nocardia sp. NPDC005978 TaxID=3156725 RepID=UPI0033BA24C2